MNKKNKVVKTMKSIKMIVVIEIGGKVHQVLLNDTQRNSILNLIVATSDGAIKVSEQSIDGLEFEKLPTKNQKIK